MKQTTLKGSFSLYGKGLHTGLSLTVTFNPAPENHGYKIQRIDLPGEPIIEAIAENVVDTSRGTVVAKGEARCSTIEHAMAALYALGIDNCMIRVNGPEFPILDGSSEVFVNNIKKVGIVEQNAEKDFFIIKHKIEFRDEKTGSNIIILPDDQFSITAMISFDSEFIGSQFATLDDIQDFSKEIAPARTFVFVREIEPLLSAGLIKGGDLDNAIVIYERQVSQETLDKLADHLHVERKDATRLGYINKRPLTWSNEPARHKLLDIIGDMALIGRPIQGRIIATRPGHTINNNVTGNEPFFPGHFPKEPVMPGVLQIEAMAQSGGLLILNTLERPENYSTYFLKMDNVKFRQKVVPGDTLIFKVKLLSPVRHGISSMRGFAFVGETVVMEATFTAQIVENKTNKA